MYGREERNSFSDRRLPTTMDAIDAMSKRSRERGGFVMREQFMPIARDLGVNPGRVLDVLLHTQPRVYPEVPGVLGRILEMGGIPIFWTYGEIHRHQDSPTGYAGFQPFKLFNPDIMHLIPALMKRAESAGFELLHGSFDKMDKEEVIDPMLRAVAESRTIQGVTIADDVRENVEQLNWNFGHIGRKPTLHHIDRLGKMKQDSPCSVIHSIPTLELMSVRPNWLYVLDVDGTVVDTARLKMEWEQQFAQITS